MKTRKVCFLALIAGIVSTVSVQAGGHHGHNGGSAFAPSTGRGAGPGRPAFSSYRSGSSRYASGRMIGSAQRFASIRPGQSAFNRYSASSYSRSGRNGSFDGRYFSTRNAGAFRGANRGSTGANRVFARYSGNWHRGWDRHRDHWWHGHRCRFINNSWVIFDLGFYPWYDYPFYPYPYYSGGDYPYEDGDVYDSEPTDYDAQGQYDSSKEVAGSPVAAAQERLAREGYYRGEIDGQVGPQTRRAIMRYQSDRGLAPTGRLSDETLQSLGLH